MSLLADLLSRIKPLSGRGDVPPGLRQTVSDYSRKETIKKKIVIFSLLFILAVAAGAITVYVMDYVKTSALKNKKAAPQRSADVSSPAPSAPPAPPVQTEAKKTESQMPETAAKPSTPESKPSATVSKKPHVRREAVAKKIEPSQYSPPKEGSKRQAPAPKPVDSGQRDIFLYAARGYESRKEYAEALLNYKKALEIEPKNYIIMNNISSMLLFLNSYKEASRYSRDALNIRNDYVPSLINLGIANIQADNLSEGESYLLKALTIEPTNRYVLLNLAILYEKKGDNGKASEYFQKLLEKNDIQGYLGAARIAEKQGRTADAIMIYKEIFSMDGADPEIKRLANDNLIRLQPSAN